MKLKNIALRNVLRNKKRSILSITATAIATFSIVFMFAYIDGIELDMKNISYNYSTGQLVIRNKDYDDKIFSLDKAVDNYISVLTLVKEGFPNLEYSPRLQFPATILNGDKTYICTGLAVDFALEKNYLDLSDKIVKGSYPETSREVLIGIGLAEELGLDIGDKFTPITTTRKGASSGITFKVAGMAKFGDKSFTYKTFLAPLTDVPMMLKMDGAVSDILIKNADESNLYFVKEEINSLLKSKGFNNIEVLTWEELGMGAAMLKIGKISYTIMAIFLFILSSSVIANTMIMVVFERKKEIGTLAAMGMSGNEVIRLFFIEALVLGIIGATAGVLLGVALVVPLSIYGMDLTSAGETIDFGISWIIYPQLKFVSTSLVFLYSVFVASFISFFPSRSASKVDPVVALRAD